MDHFCATGMSFCDPLVSNGMAFGHIGSLDDDAICVCHVLQGLGGPAATKGSSQTGNRGGVSNTGLVLDLYRPGGGEELLHEIVFFVIERGTAQGGNTHGPSDGTILFIGIFPPARTRFEESVGDHFESIVE